MIDRYFAKTTSFEESVLSLSVSEFSQHLQKNLEELYPQVWVTGELSGLFKAQSGHVYATLKDQHAQIKIVIYQYVREKIIFNLEEGLKVKVLATPSLYKPRGDFQLIVKAIEPDGQGPLKLAFDQIKAKLAAEGLFNTEHKKKLPRYPQAIGLITSTGGAVLHDMMRVLMRRYPIARVHVYPTAVQGKEANAQIIKALGQAALEHCCDVYIIARGGGSLEDLWCFNSEDVVRALYLFPYPIISAIGHETDVTLADLVADLRAATPSVAAELAVPDIQDIYNKIHELSSRFKRSMMTTMQTQEQRLDYLIRLFKKPELLLERFSLILSVLSQRLYRYTSYYVEEMILRMNKAQHSLKDSLSQYNQRQLSREYKIKALVGQFNLAIQHHDGILEQRLEFLEFRMKQLDPIKQKQQRLALSTLDGFSLTSALGLKSHSKAYLDFPDGRWEIEFIKFLSSP